MLERGWVENEDHGSNVFDLKWSIKNSELDHMALWPGQIVNHFDAAACLTTKMGLCMRVRQLAWFEPADHRRFYPRCYALHDRDDKPAFLQVGAAAHHTCGSAVSTCVMYAQKCNFVAGRL